MLPDFFTSFSHIDGEVRCLFYIDGFIGKVVIVAFNRDIQEVIVKLSVLRGATIVIDTIQEIHYNCILIKKIRHLRECLIFFALYLHITQLCSISLSFLLESIKTSI